MYCIYHITVIIHDQYHGASYQNHIHRFNVSQYLFLLVFQITALTNCQTSTFHWPQAPLHILQLSGRRCILFLFSFLRYNSMWVDGAYTTWSWNPFPLSELVSHFFDACSGWVLQECWLKASQVGGKPAQKQPGTFLDPVISQAESFAQTQDDGIRVKVESVEDSWKFKRGPVYQFLTMTRHYSLPDGTVKNSGIWTRQLWGIHMVKVWPFVRHSVLAEGFVPVDTMNFRL